MDITTPDLFVCPGYAEAVVGINNAILWQLCNMSWTQTPRKPLTDLAFNGF